MGTVSSSRVFLKTQCLREHGSGNPVSALKTLPSSHPARCFPKEAAVAGAPGERNGDVRSFPPAWLARRACGRHSAERRVAFGSLFGENWEWVSTSVSAWRSGTVGRGVEGGTLPPWGGRSVEVSAKLSFVQDSPSWQSAELGEAEQASPVHVS